MAARKLPTALGARVDTADDGLEAGMAAHLLSEALTRLPGRACCALRAAAACGIAEA